MLARSGSYAVKSRLIDDDKQVWLDFEWGKLQQVLETRQLTVRIQTCQRVVDHIAWWREFTILRDETRRGTDTWLLMHFMIYLARPGAQWASGLLRSGLRPVLLTGWPWLLIRLRLRVSTCMHRSAVIKTPPLMPHYREYEMYGTVIRCLLCFWFRW